MSRSHQVASQERVTAELAVLLPSSLTHDVDRPRCRHSAMASAHRAAASPGDHAHG